MRLGPSKKPIAARFLVALLLTGAGEAAAEVWTVEAGRERVLSHPHFAGLRKSAITRERARGRAALPRNNPFVGFQREASFGAGGAGAAENYLWLGHTFDLSFRRGLLEAAGDGRATAAGLTEDARARDALLAFDRVFYAALATSARLLAWDEWIARLEELAQRTRAREAQGDASRYEVFRLEREIVKAQQSRTRVELEDVAMRAELAAWLGDAPEALRLKGALRPADPPASAQIPRSLVAQAFDEEARARTSEADATGRWFLPPVTATGGGKTVDTSAGSELGYLFTLQVPIPLLERRDAQRAALFADKRAVEAAAEMEAHHDERRAIAAHALWLRALAALDAQRAASKERSDALVKTARAAWGGGELSLLALLEAERTTLDDRLADISLAHVARDAQLTFTSLASIPPKTEPKP